MPLKHKGRNVATHARRAAGAGSGEADAGGVGQLLGVRQHERAACQGRAARRWPVQARAPRSLHAVVARGQEAAVGWWVVSTCMPPRGEWSVVLRVLALVLHYIQHTTCCAHGARNSKVQDVHTHVDAKVEDVTAAAVGHRPHCHGRPRRHLADGREPVEAQRGVAQQAGGGEGLR